MKLWTISDLHLSDRQIANLDEQDVFFDVPDADVAIVAGDLADGNIAASIEWLAVHVGRHMPTIFVLGNHDYYGSAIDRTLADAAAAADRHGIHLLENSDVTIAGTRFIGATLWTDYHLYNPDADPEVRRRCMSAAKHGMPDHGSIDLVDGQMTRFLPMHARSFHLESVARLDQALSQDFLGETVVVSHHAPHADSVHQQYKGDILTPAYASDLSALIEKHQPAAWIHGHVHDAFDYTVGETRIVCNPRGYGHEMGGFDPEMVVNIGRWGFRPPGL